MSWLWSPGSFGSQSDLLVGRTRLRCVVVGLFLDLVLALWWMGLVPDTNDCGFWDVPKLVLACW